MNYSDKRTGKWQFDWFSKRRKHARTRQLERIASRLFTLLHIQVLSLVLNYSDLKQVASNPLINEPQLNIDGTQMKILNCRLRRAVAREAKVSIVVGRNA